MTDFNKRMRNAAISNLGGVLLPDMPALRQGHWPGEAIVRMCTECLRVNGHHPNCPEAEDYDDTEDDMCGDGEEFFPGDRERAEEAYPGRG